MKRRYTWRPDLPDARDHLFARATRAIPDQVDLRHNCSPVEDQGQLGSCTGNAWAGALEYLEVKAGGAFVNLSRLFIYYQERAIEGTIGQDAGAQIRDGAKALNKLGVCDERIWPYSDGATKFKKKPTPRAYRDAATRKISQYQRITNLDGMLSCLAEGFPVVFGFSVYENFESAAVARSGIVSMPQPNEKLLGGHAVLAVGYDVPSKHILVRNSWGAGWGLQGYFWLPFGYVESRALSDDFWTVRK